MQLTILCMLLMLITCTDSAAPDSAVPPIALGVDSSGSDWTGRVGDPTIGRALHELGVNFVVYYPQPVTGHGADNVRLMGERIAEIDKWMRGLGLRYTLNNNLSNWVSSVTIEPGVNELAHPDGTHRWDLRIEWLKPILPPVLAGEPALVGITYDEAEHMQLTGHEFATYPDGKPFEAPCFVDTKGKDPVTAYNRLVAKCKWIRTRHYQNLVAPCTEQVWPDMFHIFARAGWTITPKLLKENLSSVVMAISLGAALEYEDQGGDWWVSPDLWCQGYYPGHSPQALRSALLMGYWLGTNTLYVENMDFPEWKLRHPLAPPRGSLVEWTPGGYSVTPYGEVVKDFYTRYVPSHPRHYTWRDYRPRVAIVRLPDGACGQRGTIYRDRLLGNPDHPTDAVSAEWLDVWPILTHGVARRGADTILNSTIYPEYPWPFFVPIDSVAVFDHLVTGSVLDLVDCFIVCGHALSERTFGDIAIRVKDGATCVIARRLYDAQDKSLVGPKGRGKWVVVDSFTDPAVAAAVKPYLGPPDVARFRFTGGTVEFRVAGNDKDAVDVTLSGGLR